MASVTSTTLFGTTINTEQESALFESEIAADGEYVVKISLFAGPVPDPPTGAVETRSFDLSTSRPTEDVAMNAGIPTLNGKLTRNNQIIEFSGNLVSPNVVNAGVKNGIVAYLEP